MSAPGTPALLRFKGAAGSPYSRKMLALLRYRRIAHAMLVPGSPALQGLPVPKVELLPTFYLPGADGELEAVTDSTPLLRRFERTHTGRAVRPPDPALAFVDSLLEDYADEWLTKAMFHYRWHFAADIAKAAAILPRWRGITGPEEQARAAGEAFAQRQIGRLRYIGSNEMTWGLIEASYGRFLSAFNAHLQAHPFVAGARPGASDFALYGQLTQLAHFDPTPAAITLAQAPRVHAWVNLVDDLAGLEPTEADWLALDPAPPTLIGLLREVARVYQPLLLANARALQRGQTELRTEIDGQPWVQNTFPYQAKCLRWLREEHAQLPAKGQARVDALLEEAGCLGVVREAV